MASVGREGGPFNRRACLVQRDRHLAVPSGQRVVQRMLSVCRARVRVRVQRLLRGNIVIVADWLRAF